MIFGPYPAKVIEIHDGDTFTAQLDLGFKITFELACRVYGINAPELRFAAGKTALAYLQTIMHIGDTVTIVSHGWDKYGGRFDGEVTLPSGTSLSALMLASGNAVPMGG
jgi:endonuclease YncB( thermonuclease family)